MNSVPQGDATHLRGQMQRIGSILISTPQLRDGLSDLSMVTLGNGTVLSVEDFGSANGSIVFGGGAVTDSQIKLIYVMGQDIFHRRQNVVFCPFETNYRDVVELNLTCDSRKKGNVLRDCFARRDFSTK